MAENGRTATPPREGELGTAVNRYERLFGAYDAGAIFVVEDLDADRLDKMLARDGKARSIEQALTLPLRGATWSVEASAGDTGQRDFVHEALTKAANAGGMSTPLDLVIGQATAACLYRRAFFEKVWKHDGSRLVYDKLAYRPPGTCELRYDERKGAFQGFRQFVGDKHPNADEVGKVWIKPDKAFVFVYGQHRRPISGISDLETAYSIYETKQKLRFLWMAFLENHVIPKALAKHSSADPSEVNAFARKVATLKNGGVLGIGPDQDVDPFESAGSAAQAFADAWRVLDSEMSGSVLAGFTDLTGAAASGRGSFALSADQSDLFLQSREAVLKELGASVTAWVVADLVRWNFGVDASVPTFKFGPILPQHAEQALGLLNELAGQERPLVPPEFIDQLVEKVAAYLRLDVDRVSKAIRERQAQAPENPTAQLSAGIRAAAQIVQRQQQASLTATAGA